MNTRIKECFLKNKKQIVSYVTVGAPDLKKSQEYILSLIEAGTTIIELGVPFSDPTADGAVIQQAGGIALSLGVCLDDVLSVAKTIRQKYPQVPIILFSYFNVLFNYGLKKLKDLDIDGILVVDLPLEEREELIQELKGTSIDLIPLISPLTSPQRIKQIVEGCEGFVYYITVQGVTGVRCALSKDVAQKLIELKGITTLPVVAGFGISTVDMAQDVLEHTDGVVIGSALVKALLDGNSQQGISLIEQIAKRI